MSRHGRIDADIAGSVFCWPLHVIFYYLSYWQQFRYIEGAIFIHIRMAQHTLHVFLLAVSYYICQDLCWQQLRCYNNTSIAKHTVETQQDRYRPCTSFCQLLPFLVRSILAAVQCYSTQTQQGRYIPWTSFCSPFLLGPMLSAGTIIIHYRYHEATLSGPWSGHDRIDVVDPSLLFLAFITIKLIYR